MKLLFHRAASLACKRSISFRNAFNSKKLNISEPICIPEDERVDPFGYLHELDDPRTKQYMRDEYAYTQRYLMDKGMNTFYIDLQKQLNFLMYQPNAKITAQEHMNGFVYIQVETSNKLPVYMRLKVPDDRILPYNEIMKKFDKFEVILDQNVIYNQIRDGSYFHMGKCKLDNTHSKIVYLLDSVGDENYDLFVHDIATGRTIDSVLGLPILSAEFSQSGNEVYYTLTDELKRPSKVMKHVIGETHQKDIQIFQELDPIYFVDVNKTKDNEFVTINVNSKTTSEIWVISKDGELKRIQERILGTTYFLEHNSGHFYLITNANGATNCKIVKTPVSATESKNWVDFVPASQSGVRLDDIDMFHSHICLYEKDNGKSRIRVVNLSNEGDSFTTESPIDYCALSPGMNGNYNSNTINFSYSTPVRDESFGQISLTSKSSKFFELSFDRESARAYLNSDDYVIKQILVPSPDGVMIPMTIVHHKHRIQDGSAPAIIFGYGSYGSSLESRVDFLTIVNFEAQRQLLLRKGFLLAFAHVRGGGELGKEWHDAGKKLKKINTFNDFITCTEWLIENKYTTPEKLAAKGVSAGGLLMGAVANHRPDLYATMILKVPFLDVISTMSDPTLPLTQHEVDEWGDINDPEARECIESYSPYQNLKDQAYPNMMITTSVTDYRAPYWNALKYVAKLRSLPSRDSEVFLKINDFGHGDEAGKDAYLDNIMFEYAFLYKTLKLKADTYV